MTSQPYPAAVSVDGEDYAVMVTERSPTDFVAVIDGPASGTSTARLEGRGTTEETALYAVKDQLVDVLKREDAAES